MIIDTHRGYIEMLFAFLLTFLIPLTLNAQGEIWVQIENGLFEGIMQPTYQGGFNGAFVDLVDIDSDGDADLSVMQYTGEKTLYRNIRSENGHRWEIDNSYFEGVEDHSGIGYRHRLVDIDQDGDADLFIARSHSLHLYLNIGTGESPIWSLIDTNYQNIETRSYTPFKLTDVDGDGDFDLLIVRSNRISFYENVVVDDKDSLVLRDSDYARNRGAPIWDLEAGDVDGDGDIDLFLDKGFGVWFLENTSTMDTSTWVWSKLQVGLRETFEPPSTLALGDIDKDLDLDFVLGMQVDFLFCIEGCHPEMDLYLSGGGIKFYENIGSTSTPEWDIRSKSYIALDIGDHLAPSFADLDGDGDQDFFIRKNFLLDRSYFYENMGNASEADWYFKSNNYFAFLRGTEYSLSFVDIDNDGDLDLYTGHGYWEDNLSFWIPRGGNISFYRNVGSASTPEWILEEDSIGIDNSGSFKRPTFGDIDNDGDFDLVYGNRAGYVIFYHNVGSIEEPSWAFSDSIYTGGIYASPALGDVDLDGDLDLVVGIRPDTLGVDEGRLLFYRNVGTPDEAIWEYETDTYGGVPLPEWTNPSFVNIDGDGDLDLFVGVRKGGMIYLENQILTSINDNQTGFIPNEIFLSQNHPNPFNPVTTISYSLPVSGEVTLIIYNLLGEEVARLVDGFQQAGEYRLSWNASNVSSGIYFYRLSAGNYTETKKMVLLK